MTTNRILLEWKRSQSLEFPKVWHTFKARDLDSDELVEYRIQDIPESRISDVLDHMCKNYIADEPVSQALGTIQNHISLQIHNELNFGYFIFYFIHFRRWQ